MRTMNNGAFIEFHVNSIATLYYSLSNYSNGSVVLRKIHITQREEF